ncbi:uncharacterized protein TM35_000021180 [Trypanosoma theileri]|uniref:J domain-containing protein n=1 Tax=Trypanosoma theileri TaxID=67003 RepID=A0A1X0P789_9TRYP|nr:uncharacterized protein TM35_000021180 [Trypanosoma theileri]ORC92792.1 hypothetical protein TM35_000021180 [Trypanosoma theileri]
MDAVAVASAILDCGPAAEAAASLRVLSLAPALPPVTADTPVAEARRNYMRLAGLVHPDKLKSRFDRATEAFQRLVQAFERVADPKFRKQLLAEQAKEERKRKQQEKKKEGGAAVKRPREQKKKQEPVVKRQKTTKPTTKEPKSNKKKTTKLLADDDDDFIDYDNDDMESTDQEEEASEEYDDGEDEDINFEDLEPTVSTSRVLLGTKRTGGIYRDTKVSCPQCRTQWVPDSKQHYSLFMGPAGKKVHCETCLCRFGCATALHACPHCSGNFDYDVSMYDKTIECKRCNQTIGFPYYPVNQQLIDLVKLEEWREQEEEKRTRERDERAARRNQSEDGTSEEFHQLVGACIVNEMCPLCQRTITARHRQHIETCLKTKGSKSSVVSAEKTTRKTTAPAKKTITTRGTTKTVKAASPQPKKAKVEKKKTTTTTKTKQTRRRRRRGSDSTDSEDDESSFASSSDYDE